MRGRRRTARIHGARRSADRGRVGDNRRGGRGVASRARGTPRPGAGRSRLGGAVRSAGAPRHRSRVPDQGSRDGRHGHAPRRGAGARGEPAHRAGRRKRAGSRGAGPRRARWRRWRAVAAPRSTSRATRQPACTVASSSRTTPTCTPRIDCSSCSPPPSRTERASASTSERPPRRRLLVVPVATHSSSRTAPRPPCCASMSRSPRRPVTGSCCGGRPRPGRPCSAASSSIRCPLEAFPGGGRPPNAWRPWPRPRRPAISQLSAAARVELHGIVASERDGGAGRPRGGVRRGPRGRPGAPRRTPGGCQARPWRPSGLQRPGRFDARRP